MKKEDFAELKGSLTEALAHAQGKVTLKTRDIPLPPPVEEIKPADIVKLRQKLNASQGVFARMLNVSRDTEISWETGRRKPSGAALRLLQIVRIEPDILPRLADKAS
jgi:putative transcriptional regulator